MSEIAMGPHPEFDALSAYADLDDARAARSRTGRHVVRCATCSAEVSEIRALGAAVRALDVEPTSAELWERIKLAASDGEASTDTMLGERAVAIEPQREDRARTNSVQSASTRRLAPKVIAGAGLVLALAAVALWPGRSSLDATATSRLTFTPGRPVPGGMMTVRYRPARWFAGAPKLVLAGRFVTPAAEPREQFVGSRDGLDSLATLYPTANGNYEARVRLPDEFLGVRLAVFDSTGALSDRDGHALWIAIGGTRDHAPSLTALIASFTSMDGRQLSHQSVSVADSIQRYFPGHPAGWALYERYGTTKGIFDFFRYFATAERKYSSLDESLWPKRALDAEQMWAMASLAQKISEPAEEAKWAQRLAREHPEDPRAFRALASSVRAMELRDPPHVADSIRPWLPILDSLYLRSHPVLDPTTFDMEMLTRRGDSTERAGWSMRMHRVRPYFTRGGLPGTPDATTEAEVRRRLAAGCARPSGKFPLPDLSAWTQWCTFDHQLLWQYLAESHLTRGESRVAQAFADSAIALGGQCSDRTALQIRGDARLSLADSAGAARDYAYEYGRWTVLKETRARAASRLGTRFDSATFDAIADSSRREALGCLRRRKEADSVREARYSAP